jgi:hypothetical protein
MKASVSIGNFLTLVFAERFQPLLSYVAVDTC